MENKGIAKQTETKIKTSEQIMEKVDKSKVLRMEDFTTIYVLGSRSAGKTMLINRFLEKTDKTKPTLGLDYEFAKRTTLSPDSSGPIKEVCFIWELGGDVTKFPDLIATPIITNHSLDKMAIFLVIDLSSYKKIWQTLDISLKYLKRGITRALADNLRTNKEDLTKKLEQNIVKRLGDNFPDKPFIEPFPLPIVMICTKFDLFQNFEPERRKVICRMLRLASHRLGASLNFFSENDVAHKRRIRELFSHYAYNTKFPKDISHSVNQGIQIPHGGDTYEQIWPGCNPSQFSFDFFKHHYETQIGKSDEKEQPMENPADDTNFREPQIDSQRNIILEELRMAENSFKDSDISDARIVQNR